MRHYTFLLALMLASLACFGFTPPFPQVSAGHGASCVRDSDGHLYCIDPNPYLAHQMPEAEDFVEVRVGWLHGCARHSDRTVECWGYNGDGQTEVPAGKYLGITVGINHSCGLQEDYRIICWGSNRMGQSQVPEEYLEADFIQVVAGSFFTCGLQMDGQAVCWGENNQGQTQPPGNVLFGWLAAGDEHACGIRSLTNEVVCWGRPVSQYDARVATGEMVAVSGDWESGSMQSTPYVEVMCGGQHTCALQANGHAVCWGDNTYGQLDAPDHKIFVELSAGWHHTCGVTHSSEVLCWGHDE